MRQNWPIRCGADAGKGKSRTEGHLSIAWRNRHSRKNENREGGNWPSMIPIEKQTVMKVRKASGDFPGDYGLR